MYLYTRIDLYAHKWIHALGTLLLFAILQSMLTMKHVWGHQHTSCSPSPSGPCVLVQLISYITLTHMGTPLALLSAPCSLFRMPFSQIFSKVTQPLRPHLEPPGSSYRLTYAPQALDSPQVSEAFFLGASCASVPTPPSLHCDFWLWACRTFPILPMMNSSRAEALPFPVPNPKPA
jgi:hypothetical protein